MKYLEAEKGVMDMVEVRPALKDIMSYIKALQEYFSMRNKVLITGSFSTGATVRIPNGALYESFAFAVGNVMAYAYSSPNVLNFYASGGNNSTKTHVTRQIKAEDVVVDGNDLVINDFVCGSMWHEGNSHGVTAQTCNVIIGIDPIIPDALKAMGGGYNVNWRWLSCCL